MMQSVRGTYRNGRIEFAESLPVVLNESEVIITFLSEKSGEERKLIDLRGIAQGKVSEDVDIEALRHEVVTEWKHDLEEFGNAS